MLIETYIILDSRTDMFLGYTISCDFTIDGTYYTTPLWVTEQTYMFGSYADIDFVQVADINEDTSLSNKCIVASELFTLLNNISDGGYIFVVPVKLVYDKQHKLLNHMIEDLEKDYLRMVSVSEFLGIGKDIELIKNSWETTPYVSAKPII